MFLLLALGAAAVNGFAVHDLGAPLALVAFVAFTSLTAVFGGLVNLFHRPRRFRV